MSFHEYMQKMMQPQQRVKPGRWLNATFIKKIVKIRQDITRSASDICGLSEEAYSSLCDAIDPMPREGGQVSRRAWLVHQIDLFEKLLNLSRNSLVKFDKEFPPEKASPEPSPTSGLVFSDEALTAEQLQGLADRKTEE